MTTAVAAAYTEELVQAAEVRVQLRTGGTGAPLLVLHSELGVPGWLQAYAELANHFTVYVPSLPGFGQSSRPDWIATVRDLAAWVTWFARDLQLPHPLPVIGCGLGGWVAAEIATMHASLFSQMVLVAPAGLKPEHEEIWDYFAHSGPQAFAQAFYDPTQAPEYGQYYGRAWTPEEEDQIEGNREMVARVAWKPYLRSHTLAALLGGVATPTLLVWGREDGIIPLSACQLYQRAIKGSRVHILDQCGHLPDMEKPAELVHIVLSFLATQSARPTL